MAIPPSAQTVVCGWKSCYCRFIDMYEMNVHVQDKHMQFQVEKRVITGVPQPVGLLNSRPDSTILVPLVDLCDQGTLDHNETHNPVHMSTENTHHMNQSAHSGVRVEQSPASSNQVMVANVKQEDIDYFDPNVTNQLLHEPYCGSIAEPAFNPFGQPMENQALIALSHVQGAKEEPRAVEQEYMDVPPPRDPLNELEDQLELLEGRENPQVGNYGEMEWLQEPHYMNEQHASPAHEQITEGGDVNRNLGENSEPQEHHKEKGEEESEEDDREENLDHWFEPHSPILQEQEETRDRQVADGNIPPEPAHLNGNSENAASVTDRRRIDTSDDDLDFEIDESFQPPPAIEAIEPVEPSEPVAAVEPVEVNKVEERREPEESSANVRNRNDQQEVVRPKASIVKEQIRIVKEEPSTSNDSDDFVAAPIKKVIRTRHKREPVEVLLKKRREAEEALKKREEEERREAEQCRKKPRSGAARVPVSAVQKRKKTSREDENDMGWGDHSYAKRTPIKPSLNANADRVVEDRNKMTASGHLLNVEEVFRPEVDKPRDEKTPRKSSCNSDEKTGKRSIKSQGEGPVKAFRRSNPEKNNRWNGMGARRSTYPSAASKSEESIELFRCLKGCARAYKSRQSLDRHYQKNHGENVDNVDDEMGEEEQKIIKRRKRVPIECYTTLARGHIVCNWPGCDYTSTTSRDVINHYSEEHDNFIE